MTKITVGADPELFAFRGDVPISVHDLLPGTKWSPCKVPRGAIQVDGVAAEFNIEPAHDKKTFIRNLTHVHRVMEKILKTADPTLRLRAVPTVHFEQSYFDDLPSESKALGCEPDYNAYHMTPNPKPETTKPMRTGSGHIHIGWEGCDKTRPEYVPLVGNIVKELDFTIGRQAVLWDNDTERMDLYGAPGSFRFKPYGLEYRVLSNRWLARKELMAFIFDATVATVKNVLDGKVIAPKYHESEIGYRYYLQKHEIPFVGDYYEEAA